MLQPLIDDGVLVVQSGQTDIEQAATLRWDGEEAQSRMENIITANYSDGTKVNAVLSPYDGISRGIIGALTDAGYTVGAEWPIISGQDAEIDSVKAILSGEQFATIVDGARQLSDGSAQLADGALQSSQGANQLSDGMALLGENGPRLADGGDQLVIGIGELRTGTSQLAAPISRAIQVRVWL